jgi:iron-sulfur cluster insertion protein
MTLSDSAAIKIKDLIIDENIPGLMLRAYVQGGGCSGMQYGFTFEEKANEDDTRIEKEGIVLLVDSMSISYLNDAEIDYKDGLQGSGFQISNPNAKASCGCGSSFAV